MKFKIAIITIVLVCTQVVYSQTKTVTGSVVDDDGAPLPGVSVLVLGTSTGTSTDFDGKFSIENVDADSQLIFSFVGMTDQTISVGAQSEINVSNLLTESLKSFKE